MSSYPSLLKTLSWNQSIPTTKTPSKWTSELLVHTATFPTTLKTANVERMWNAFVDGTGYCPHRRSDREPIKLCKDAKSTTEASNQATFPSQALTVIANAVSGRHRKYQDASDALGTIETFTRFPKSTKGMTDAARCDLMAGWLGDMGQRDCKAHLEEASGKTGTLLDAQPAPKLVVDTTPVDESSQVTATMSSGGKGQIASGIEEDLTRMEMGIIGFSLLTLAGVAYHLLSGSDTSADRY